MKLEAERIVERSEVPWTILRATQFHKFLLRFIRLLGRFPAVPVPRGFLFQPIDVGEAADRTAELALADPAGRVPDIGGPETRIFADLALNLWFEASRAIERKDWRWPRKRPDRGTRTRSTSGTQTWTSTCRRSP